MMKFTAIFILLFTVSCTLLRGFRKRELAYADAGVNGRVRVLVPKGYSREAVQTDSAGNKEQVYTYGGGVSFYFIQAADTVKPHLFIDTSNHVPRLHPAGGRVFKGQNGNGTFWREIYAGRYRFGYRNVPRSLEARFDSALNYAGYVLPGR